LHHEGAFCPCCGMALRVTPTSKRDKEKLRLARESLNDIRHTQESMIK